MKTILMGDEETISAYMQGQIVPRCGEVFEAFIVIGVSRPNSEGTYKKFVATGTPNPAMAKSIAGISKFCEAWMTQ